MISNLFSGSSSRGTHLPCVPVITPPSLRTDELVGADVAAAVTFGSGGCMDGLTAEEVDLKFVV